MSRRSQNSLIRRIGIEEIASYIPESRISNYERQEQFGITDTFINEKIGVKSIALKNDEDDTSDLCIKAYERLMSKVHLSVDNIDVAIVITQNPDNNIPHTSAIVHGKLGLSENCACFDISLGCSGFVYGLNVLQSFMQANNFKKGLLFTSDPYSKIVDRHDKNTALLFGDAAAVTLISDKPLYTLHDTTFGTIGRDYRELMCTHETLHMNGREVFNFIAQKIPKDITHLIERNGLTINDIDKFVFHQGSKHIVDTLAKLLKVDRQRVVFDIYEYGNTVSSTIPIILEKEIKDSGNKYIAISGFGVGLSWASGLLIRN